MRPTKAQLTESAKIGLVTIGEGADVASLYGHTAIRIKDPQINLDEIFHYGTYQFDPNQVRFAIKFAKGSLMYQISAYHFEGTIEQYRRENRSIRMQWLACNLQQIETIRNALIDNLEPENRYYKYDFFFDNCATRVADIFSKHLDLQLATHPDANKYTFRETIDRFQAKLPWADFGVDIALGSLIDRKITNRELTFLPGYLAEIYTRSTITSESGKVSFVTQDEMLYSPIDEEIDSETFTPGTIFWSVFGFVLLISAFGFRTITTIVDFILFLSLGLTGIVLLLLWLGTDHAMTANNYNLIWANPIHLFMLYFVFASGKKAFFSKYFQALTLIYLFLIVCWVLLPQEFNTVFVPIVFTLLVRYYYWFRNSRQTN